MPHSVEYFLLDEHLVADFYRMNPQSVQLLVVLLELWMRPNASEQITLFTKDYNEWKLLRVIRDESNDLRGWHASGFRLLQCFNHLCLCLRLIMCIFTTNCNGLDTSIHYGCTQIAPFSTIRRNHEPATFRAHLQRSNTSHLPPDLSVKMVVTYSSARL